MKLLELGLNNYCQYSKKRQRFDGGITILRGKNGTGKSNFMNAVFFALTGESFIKNKTRSGMLKWGARKGSVKLSLEVRGNKYEIERMLHSSAVRLTGPSLNITKSKEASEFIADLVNADAEVLKISSFMPQGGASELVFGTKGERQKAFSRLFRLLHLETYRTELQKEFNKIPAYPDVSDNITKLSSDVVLLNTELEGLGDQGKLAKYLEDEKERYQAMYDARDRTITKEDRKAKLEKLHAELTLAEVCVTKNESLLKEMPELVFLDPSKIEKQQGFKMFEKLCAAMMESTKKLEAAKVVSKRVDQTELDAVEKELTEHQLNISLAETKLALWNKGECGECGSKFDHSEAEIDALASFVVKLNEEKSDLLEKRSNLRKAMDTWLEETRAFKAAEDELNAVKREVNDQMDRYSDYDEQAYLAELEKTRNNDKVKADRDALAGKIAELKASENALRSDIAVWEAAEVKPDDFSMEFLATYREKLGVYQNNEVKATSLRTAIELKTEQLEERRREQRLFTMANTHRKFISDMRLMLHVDKYPRLAVSVYKEKLGILINKYLAIFGQPFTININDSLEFICVFPDNPEASADESLSGGQKGMLLVSYRLAVAEMLASDVELLTFDEPGAAMDKDAKEGLLEAFDAVRKYLSGKRVQMLIASHDDNIEGVADGIIQL